MAIVLEGRLNLVGKFEIKLDCCEPFVPTTRQYYIPFIYNIADIIFRAGSLTGRVGCVLRAI